MNLIVLHDELVNDPLGRGYVAMTDAQAATDLNTNQRTALRTRVETWELLEATVNAEYDALATANRTKYNAILAMGTINPAGTNVRAILSALFGAGTVTRTNLLALQNRTVNRAEELGLGRVEPGDVQAARAWGSV